MKDPVISIKKAIVATLGSSFTANSQTVQVYTNAPQKAPDYFVWGQEVTMADVGTKDNFITDVDYEIVCVARENVAAGSSLTLDLIADHVLQNIVLRGVGIADPSGNFNIFSAMLVSSDENREILTNKSEITKRLRIIFKCQEL